MLLCAPHNGQTHCYSASKIVTVLLYLNNEAWDEDGGRLRVLNSPDSLDDYAEEINPNWGTLLVFRSTKDSW
ncbi:MAG: 2OG-Fe(II) oxygenase [Candidatus Micropelagos thuwalensis]|nr:2OG-Fe(II) oxygenase [Candidatus Micropelagos thuwalensis]